MNLLRFAPPTLQIFLFHCAAALPLCLGLLPTAPARAGTVNLLAANSVSHAIREASPRETDHGIYANTGLCGPRGMVFDSSGNLYVANPNNAVEKYSSTGTDLDVLARTGLNVPQGVAFDSRGDLLRSQHSWQRQESELGARL